MIFIAFFLGIILSVCVNGMADNLPAEYVSYSDVSAWLLPRCAYCGSTRKLSDWLAVLSSVVRRGGCARCGAPRPMRDVLVEGCIIIAMLFLCIHWTIGVIDLIAEGILVALFVLITVVDLEHRLVISEVMLAGGFLVLVGGMRNGFSWMLPMMLGGAAGLGTALLFFLFGQLLFHLAGWDADAEPLGFGDVMIAGLVGLATGWPGVIMAMFLAVFLGGIGGVVVLLMQWFRHRSSAWTTMAYGPYLAIAALLMHFAGGSLANLLVR